MNNFDFNLSLVLAHTIQCETYSLYNPYRIVALNGGDPPPASTAESTAQQLGALTNGLPGLMNAIGSSILPYSQQLQGAQNQIAPQQAALNTSLYSQYVPQLNEINNSLNNTNALQSAQTGANVLSGPGQQELQAAQAAQQQLDPQYYSTRALAGQQANNLLNSINLNGLSGSEAAEVERSNAQQDASRGIANTPSQLATVNNAMNFGSALNTKRSALSNAISTATNFLPSAQGPINALGVVGQNVAQGVNSAGNAATQFSGVQTSQAGQLGGASNSQASGELGNINSTANTSANISAQQRDTLDRVNQTLGSSASVIGSL